ncbi:RHOQ protein [Acanthamoeba castellanii str. Neff]|uniref:RHOQ protein n=1 Tax=Acanthamoeba castellanii (strain ATCC 30010 / Neff) TaxID=1257118 RepID=L8GU84_ACACF|nr:RHOQ protein [Acanthamoeba castellanii str. Neff]ELR16507.1 RHOQ protein [Acanthamoeba castellanii str. Neff]
MPTSPGYVPTVFDHYNKTVTSKVGNTYKLGIWDTAGQEDFDRMRALFYQGAHLFLLCFSVVSSHHDSFEGVKQRWKDELRVHGGDKPFLSSAQRSTCEMTLTPKSQLTPITTEQGRQLAREVGAEGYYECSAKKHIGLKEVFAAATEVIKKHDHKDETAARVSDPKASTGCCLLQ